jgi:hypothetical protein
MEESIFNDRNVEYNPNQILFTPENSPFIKKKVDAANEMLRKTGFPNCEPFIKMNQKLLEERENLDT